MDLKFTPFITYRNINVDDVDIFEDALGLNTEFKDVIEALGRLNVVPGKRLILELMEKISSQN